MVDLTADEIRKITEQLVQLRKKIRSNGATALNPNPEWNTLRKEIALLDKKLNADTASKDKARRAAPKGDGAA